MDAEGFHFAVEVGAFEAEGFGGAAHCRAAPVRGCSCSTRLCQVGILRIPHLDTRDVRHPAAESLLRLHFQEYLEQRASFPVQMSVLFSAGVSREWMRIRVRPQEGIHA